MERETRSIKTELRVAASGDGGTLKGYAASFNCLSAPIMGGKRGSFREKIAPGAFDATIMRGDDIYCLQQHKPDLVMGRTKNGTLTLRADSHGLYMECALPPTQAAQDLRALVLRGDVDEMSFGFTDTDDEWDDGEDPDSGERCVIRTIRSCKLLDVSAVVFPAYPTGTAVSARSRGTDYIVRAADYRAVENALRRHNRILGAEIAASDSRAAIQDELRERMQNAAGIVFGRKR